MGLAVLNESSLNKPSNTTRSIYHLCKNQQQHNVYQQLHNNLNNQTQRELSIICARTNNTACALTTTQQLVPWPGSTWTTSCLSIRHEVSGLFLFIGCSFLFIWLDWFSCEVIMTTEFTEGGWDYCVPEITLELVVVFVNMAEKCSMCEFPLKELIMFVKVNRQFSACSKKLP